MVRKFSYNTNVNVNPDNKIYFNKLPANILHISITKVELEVKKPAHQDMRCVKLAVSPCTCVTGKFFNPQ